MSWVIWLVIIGIFGVIIGNLLLLRDTAKQKLPSLPKHPPGEKKSGNNENWDKDDDWPKR
ncbi:DUF2897 family protein [Aliiglaciecola sp. CAU 1673]|uniref:DUF2897 family protein n=1 Tax=Aliiglaciecola sp. CAU 1673 TaxID=3032595 RepID=UPI0023D9FCFA|nr:DUF2897 family protein [Aliiglaciecola sp. CAU 1673]MDF2177744.1 DUF2897 family protein [Aliiglaciecola sp. CAU 1673]